MKNIGMVLYAPSQINSFLNSRVIEELNGVFELKLLISDQALNPRLTKDIEQSCFSIELPKVCRKLSGYLQMLALWRFRNRSMNHLVRAMASFGSKADQKRWKCVVVSEMNVKFFKRVLVRLAAQKPLYEFFKFLEGILLTLLFVPRAKARLSDLDALLVPFSGHIGADFGCVVFAAKKIGIPVFGIQENWDNLSTKTFISQEPDFFLVWGEQSAGHLRSVHRLFNVEPIVVGSPRFAPYYNDGLPPQSACVSEVDGSNHDLENQVFILVAGTGDGIDDEMLVRSVYQTIQDNLDKLPENVKLVYRPHPATRTQTNWLKMKLEMKNLLVDNGPTSREFGHHNALVLNAKIVINHFSTLAIESIIAGTKVIIPLFLGRTDATYRYEHILNEWHHMMGLALIPEIETPKEVDEFSDTLLRLMQEEKCSDTSTIRIEWICKKTDYVEALATAIITRV